MTASLTRMADKLNPYGTADRCSPEEFAAFVADARAECVAKLNRLAAVDPDSLPPDARAQYDQLKAECERVLALLENDALELHAEATEHAGRELTYAEASALVRRRE